MDLIEGIPCRYLAMATVWSLYQGFRGSVETRLANRDKDWAAVQKVVVLDIHDFAFRFVCTLAGFFALFAAYRIAETVHELANVSTGSATLLVLSFLIGVIGVWRATARALHHVQRFGRSVCDDGQVFIF